MPLRVRLLVLGIAALAGACGNPIPPATVMDAARPDTGVLVDAAPGTDAARLPDTGLDGGVSVDADDDAAVDAPFFGRDANFDAGDLRAFDAWIPDDVGNDTFMTDSGPAPDSSGCLLPDGGIDVCTCGTFGADCSASACASGEACVADACGMHCLPVGAPCAGPSDCPATSTCDAASSRCTHAGGGCGDSRDCAPGFTCEAGACVDRAIPCDSFDGCPFGFMCTMDGGAGVCARQSRPCGTSVGCGSLRCIDVNGDGTTECNFDGTCTTNATCPAAGDVCAPRSVERFAGCGRYGPCLVSGDCASGMSCLDLWGDGVPECVDGGGTCTRSSDCPVGTVCATPIGGGPPACLDGL
jgi:hypothetical protein